MRRFHWIGWDMAAPGEGTEHENMGGSVKSPYPPFSKGEL